MRGNTRSCAIGFDNIRGDRIIYGNMRYSEIMQSTLMQSTLVYNNIYDKHTDIS